MFTLILHRSTLLRRIPKFHLITWCTNFVETHSFLSFSGDTPKLSGNCRFPQNSRTKKSVCVQWLSMLRNKRWVLTYENKPNNSYMTSFSLGCDVFCASAFHD